MPRTWARVPRVASEIQDHGDGWCPFPAHLLDQFKLGEQSLGQLPFS